MFGQELVSSAIVLHAAKAEAEPRKYRMSVAWLTFHPLMSWLIA